MTRTMVAVSLIGTQPDHRYDFMATPGGVAYFRVQTPTTRSRWKRTYFNLTNYPIDTSAAIIAGPALLEITEEEGVLIDAGDSIHPPRNVGLRAERIRKNWKARGSMHVSRLDSWLEDWRFAIKNDDELWLKARTSWNGRAHNAGLSPAPSAPSAPSNPSKGSSAVITAVNAPVTAAEPETPKTLNAASPPTFSYPEIIKGSILRPNGEAYRVRKIGRTPDVKIFREMREERVHSLAFGQPGTGKTAVFDAAFGQAMITMMGSEDIEAADFVGSYVETDDGRWVWEDGPLLIAMVNGWVLFIDEVGVIRQKQMSLLYSVMDGRDEIRVTANPKRGVIKAQPGFAVCGSTNPDSPEVRLTDALLSRFGFKIEITSDYNMARTALGVPEWLVGAAENMELRRRSKEMPWAPQTRDLLLWKKNAAILGEPGASGVMVNSAPVTARNTVADILTKTSGKSVKALALS